MPNTLACTRKHPAPGSADGAGEEDRRPGARGAPGPVRGPRGRRAARQAREEEGVPGVARVDAEGQTQTPFRSRVFYSAYLTPYIHYIERQTPLYPLYKERNALIHYIERQTPSYE